jgi:hypothetical protein
MAQGVLGFKYEVEKNESGYTGLAGLPLYLELARMTGLSRDLDELVGVRRESQGWRDRQVGMALILLNLAGGDKVEDIEKLEGDEGFKKILERVELSGMSRRQRREQQRRWRKEKTRTVPSLSAIFRYLSRFHDAEQEKQRQTGAAFIPKPNEHLQGLGQVNRKLVASIYGQQAGEVATLDQDATLVETGKKEALYCYQHYKAYQPLNTYWAEQGLVLHSEFRDGNVPAGYEQVRVLEEALGMLPAGVKKARLRSDTAGYQQELLKYCAEGKNPRFGVIEFAISADVTPEFRKAVGEVEEKEWQPIWREVNGTKVKSGREWAEVCFVPNWAGHSKKGPSYRYLATREAMENLLPGMEPPKGLPFQTLEMNRQRYKVFGYVTNRGGSGEEVIVWQQERCGKSEEIHKVMKEDMAGGSLPSGDFGENAAWWGFMVLALNLNEAMKRHVLKGEWARRRMKALRYGVINVVGRVVEKARQLKIRLGQHGIGYALFLRARVCMLSWKPVLTG